MKIFSLIPFLCIQSSLVTITEWSKKTKVITNICWLQGLANVLHFQTLQKKMNIAIILNKMPTQALHLIIDPKIAS